VESLDPMFAWRGLTFGHANARTPHADEAQTGLMNAAFADPDNLEPVYTLLDLAIECT